MKAHPLPPPLKQPPRFRVIYPTGELKGKPVCAGTVSIALYGTTIPAPSYADADATIVNATPVFLDSNGEADIYLLPGSYSITIYDAFGIAVLQYTYSLKEGDNA